MTKINSPTLWDVNYQSGESGVINMKCTIIKNPASKYAQRPDIPISEEENIVFESLNLTAALHLIGHGDLIVITGTFLQKPTMAIDVHVHIQLRVQFYVHVWIRVQVQFCVHVWVRVHVHFFGLLFMFMCYPSHGTCVIQQDYRTLVKECPLWNIGSLPTLGPISC